jgi:sterol desaturase/sphingolipid hydroxylase (fatty acid hydroxylase superfamily)
MSEPVTQLFVDRQPGPSADDLGPDFVAVARAISAIAATRMLLLVAVLTGAAIWGYACFDPTRDRLYVAIAFSLVFVLPQTWLYWRKG